MKYKFDAQIHNKLVSCRAFTLGEYKDLIKAKLDFNMKAQVNKLINDCTNAKGLNRAEEELLLVKLWAHSMGEVNHLAEHKCECGQRIEVPITLDHTQIQEYSDLIYDFGQFKVKFNPPRIFDDEDAIKMVCNSIDCIIVNSERIKVEDLSEQELNDLYSAFTFEDTKAIVEMLLENTVYLASPVKCQCGKQDVFVLKGLRKFMELF